jgi:hypothetical protein
MNETFCFGGRRKRPLGRFRRIWEYTIKIDVKEIG